MVLTPPRKMSLEQAIAYIEDDELVEVTPGAIRLRKRFLDPHARKRAERRAETAAAASNTPTRPDFFKFRLSTTHSSACAAPKRRGSPPSH